MAIQLFDPEPSVMAVLWKEGDKTAKRIINILKEAIGWDHEHPALPDLRTKSSHKEQVEDLRRMVADLE